MSEEQEFYDMVKYSHIIEVRDLIKHITKLSDAKRSIPTKKIPECQQGFLDVFDLLSSKYPPLVTNDENKEAFRLHWKRIKRNNTLDDDEIFNVPPDINEALIPYLVGVYFVLSGWLSEKNLNSANVQNFGLQRVSSWIE